VLSVGFRRFLSGLIFISLLFFIRPLSAQPISSTKNLKIGTAVGWELADSLSEISGICNAFPVIGSNWLLGIQDGGNSSDIVVFDWEIRKSFVVATGLNNRDWEAITRDDERVYIGDFGNNRGNRRDLKIYRISHVDSAVFSQYWKNNVTGINKGEIRNTSLVDSIEFAFEDQLDFQPRFRHNFDCESMLVQGDSIWLFTKNWKNFKSNVYVLLNSPGKQVARKVTFINTRCLITDACWQNREVLLVGYSVFGNQYILNLDWNQKRVLSRRKIGIKPAQVEGVSVNLLHDKAFIATEKRKTQHAAIIELEFKRK
jgi:hypothetical protein